VGRQPHYLKYFSEYFVALTNIYLKTPVLKPGEGYIRA